MTITEVRDTTLARGRGLEACTHYQDVLATTTYPEFLQSMCGIYLWAYEHGVWDDALLADIPQADLNSFGIYTESVSITNPDQSDYAGCKDYLIQVEEGRDYGQQLFFFGTSEYTLTLDDTNDAEVFATANTVGIINLYGNSKCNLHILDNAVVTVTMNDNSLLCIAGGNTANLTVIANDNATVDNTEFRGHAVVGYTGNGTSSANWVLYNYSHLDYAVATTAQIKINSSGRATATEIV